MTDKSAMQFCILLMVLAVLVTFLSIQSSLDSFMATLWVIDYPGEFVKRGLVGELLSWFSGDGQSRLSLIDAIDKGLIYTFAIVFAAFSAHLLRHDRLLAIGLVVSSFSIQQFAYDVGRFDPINQLLTLLALLVISYSRSHMAMAFATFASIVMMMVHEAAALLNIPVIFSALCFLAFQKGEAWHICLRPALFYLVTCMAAFAFIVVFGGVDNLSVDAWQTYILSKPTDFTLESAALGVQDASLQHSVIMSAERLFSSSSLSRIGRVLVLSAATFWLMWKSWRLVAQHYPVMLSRLMWLPVMSVLPMFFLGIDFFRWIAAMQLGYFLLLGVVLYHSGLRVDVSRKLFFVWVLLSLYAGPLGVTVALPDRWRLAESITNLFS